MYRVSWFQNVRHFCDSSIYPRCVKCQNTLLVISIETSYMYVMPMEPLCILNYKISHKMSLTTTLDIRLNIITAVTCEALSLSNGRLSYNKPQATNGKYPVDTTVSFTCNHGFRKTGSSSSTCQTSGSWNQQTPTCTQSKAIILLISHHRTQKFLPSKRAETCFPKNHQKLQQEKPSWS